MSSHLVWKRRLGLLWSKLPKDRSTTRNVVLLYHSVEGGPWATPLDAFQRQLKWLAGNAEVVGLDALLSPEPLVETNQLRVALTFDDGYRTLHDVVAPMLQDYGFTATVYLNTAHIGDERHCPSDAEIGHYPAEEFMTWSEVAGLQRQDWTIGSHGMHHLDMTVQSESELLRQLTTSKKEIAGRLATDCRHFSYPWGRHRLSVRDAVRSCGYTSASATTHGPLPKGFDLFAFPRIDIRHDYSLQDFVAVVTGRWDFIGMIQKFRGKSE